MKALKDLKKANLSEKNFYLRMSSFVSECYSYRDGINSNWLFDEAFRCRKGEIQFHVKFLIYFQWNLVMLICINFYYSWNISLNFNEEC